MFSPWHLRDQVARRSVRQGPLRTCLVESHCAGCWWQPCWDSCLLAEIG